MDGALVKRADPSRKRLLVVARRARETGGARGLVSEKSEMMGFFSKLTEKKFCAICGEQIKFMGNVKLEDGNLCKACSGKLSPWFTGRRRSTVEDIREQLAYREENKAAVAAFHTTRSLGNGVRLLLDEDAGKFVVTRARDLEEANPDVLDFSQVTGVDVDVRESRSEEKHRDKENHLVSYVPPRYTVSYRFEVTIRVNHPYFDEISFPLTPSDVTTTPEPVIAARIPDPATVREYRECEAEGEEIREILTRARQQIRDEARAAAMPKTARTCPWCGATTIPDASGCCEYCGGAMNG